MNASQGADDPIEALRTDIETTRNELTATVNELSERLSPKKRIGAVTQGVTENTRQVVGHAQGLTKDTAARAQDAARVGIAQGRHIADGREQKLIGSAALVVGLLVIWRLWKHHR